MIEVKDFYQYLVKMDGSGRATLRNRRFLKPVIPSLPAGPTQKQPTNTDPLTHEQLQMTSDSQSQPAQVEQPQQVADTAPQGTEDSQDWGDQI